MASGAVRTEPGDSEPDEEEDVYEVERIIDMRVEEGEVLYRVRWKNYASDDDTWEPEAHLEDCREVLLAYKKALSESRAKREGGPVRLSHVPALLSTDCRDTKLPMKSDVFDADSESESEPDRPRDSPGKKKKKKKKKKAEDSDEELVKEKKKKKKREKWREEKPLPAPESDEGEEEVRLLPPPPPKKDKQPDAKKRLIQSDEEEEEAPIAPKKHKKDNKAKDGGKPRTESAEGRKKKMKSKKELESSEEEAELSEGPSEAHADDAVATEPPRDPLLKPPSGRVTEKPQIRGEPADDPSKSKQKKSKSELRLQGIKALIQDRRAKRPDGSATGARETGLSKPKSPSGTKSVGRASRSEDEPDCSDASVSSAGHKSKAKMKGQDAPAPKVASASSVPGKPREEEEQGERGSSTSLFEKFLLNCEAKDRAPRRHATHAPAAPDSKDQSKSSQLKNAGKTDKKTKSLKESPARKPEAEKPEKTKEGLRSGQSPLAMEMDEKQEKMPKSQEPDPKSKEEVQRERREEEERKRKERMEEAQKERKERMEEAQKERQRLAEEARPERRPPVEVMASPDSSEDTGRWRDRRRRREDSEPRLLIACDDNQDSQDSTDRSDRTADRQPPTLNLGVELKLDWMTLEDFQKHLNGEDEALTPHALTPGELRDGVRSGNYAAVKRALSSKEEYNLDQEDSSGMSLTMLAAAGGQDDILRLLIKKGVKVNSRQKNGTTALMHAAEKNFLTTVAILLEAGACLNAQTASGETALMKACRRGNADVVRLLLEYGADCNILSKYKTNAMSFALLGKDVLVQDLLKDHLQTLATVAEDTIRAYFETRLAVLEPLFPLACHRLCEGPDFSLEFNYKPPQHPQGEGSGVLLFIFHANFLSEVTARLCGPCSVHAVILNDKFQLPIFLDSHFIYSFSPVQGPNKLFIRLAESLTAKVKLLICAYRVQLQ